MVCVRVKVSQGSESDASI